MKIRVFLILMVLLAISVPQAHGQPSQQAGFPTPITVSNAAAVNPVRVLPDSTGMTGLSFSPDGQWLTAWNGSDQLGFWAIEANNGSAFVPATSPAVFDLTGNPIYADEAAIQQGLPNQPTPLIADAHDDGIALIVISPDGQMIASSSQDNTVRVWENQTQLIELPGYNGASSQLVFNPARTILVSANQPLNEIRLWQASQKDNLQISMAGQPPLRFSPDGSLLAFVDANNTVTIKGVEEVITERSQSVLATLVGHRDRVLDLVWSGDGQFIATASQDTTLSLWDARAGKELRIFIGHTRPVQRVLFNADGTLLISASLDGTVRLWDVETGQSLTTLQGYQGAISDIAINADGTLIATSSTDGMIVLWGIGPAADITPVNVTVVPGQTQTFTTNGIMGMARQPLEAGAHPNHVSGCIIAQDEAVLAVARTEAGAVWVYAAGQGCEGAVWIAPDNARIIWSDTTTLDALPLITVPDPPPLMRIVNHAEICANAKGQARLTGDVLPYTAYPPDYLPAAGQATLESGIDVIVCHDYPTTPIENCHYLGPGNYSYIFTRLRTDDRVTLVDYATGQVIARQKFNGGTPPLCPKTTTRGEVSGDLPTPDAWASWVVGILYGSSTPAARTVVASGTLNARSLPNTESDILVLLSRETPVNLIGRNAAGDWVVALLPDMSKAWLFANLLQIALQTDIQTLPVVDGPADTIQIQVESHS